MITDQCVSITDLKRNANKYIKTLKTEGSKVIMVNNKPTAVLVDINNFNLRVEEPFEFTFDPPLDPQEILSQFDD